MKKIRYVIEALAVYFFFGIFRILPAETASNLGGLIGKTVGPRLAMNRRVRRHLLTAFPEIAHNRQTEIITGMWENLGRIFAEYPHLEEISKNVEIVNLESLDPYFKNDSPIIFVGAHIGNWEINGVTMLTQLNKPIALTYRPPNNPWVSRLLDKLRTLNGKIEAYPKSSEGGRNMMKTLKNNGRLGILIDQKYNEGIITEFFGAPAMTNPVFVQLAQRYNCPIVPVRCERIKGCKFKLTICDSIDINDRGYHPRSIEDVIIETQNIVEGWIAEKPEQWIWLHRRWRKTKETRSKRVENLE